MLGARLSFAVLLLVLALGPAGTGLAFTPDTVDLAAAEREGGVTWYTSTPVKTAQKIATLFEAQTGIKVELFRSGGSVVLRRFLLNPVGIIARTDKWPEVPKNWTDLTDSRYTGKLVMPDPSFTAIQLMVAGALSKRYGWEFYEKLRANQIMIVQSHQQVADTLKTGERLIAAEGADTCAWLDRKAGRNVDTTYPADGGLAIPAPTMVIKGGPHPNAAKALAEFMISDAVQKLFPEEGTCAARSDVEPPPGNRRLGDIKLMAVDYQDIEEQSKAHKKRFNEIFP